MPRTHEASKLTAFAAPPGGVQHLHDDCAVLMVMNIIILDDYQDAVRKLKCASMLEPFNAKVFTNTVKGIGQLSVRLRDADVLVLIRERTHFPKALLEKLPRLKLISQTGKIGSHIDVETCTRMGIAVAEGVGSPVAPAELTWALIMASVRRLRCTWTNPVPGSRW